MVSIANQIVVEKSAVITFENEVAEMAFRRYFKNNWEKLTLGLNNSTILFLAGVHGSDSSLRLRFQSCDFHPLHLV